MLTIESRLDIKRRGLFLLVFYYFDVLYFLVFMFPNPYFP